MYLKSVLIVCFALFSQYANGAESNYPENEMGHDFKIPDFPDVCPATPGRKGRKGQKVALRRGKAQSQYQWSDSAICGISQPGEVVNYRVTCEEATFIDFAVSDCCFPGDHWQLKGKVYDSYPNTAVTTSPGDPANSPGSVSRLYNYALSPGRIDALLECSYLHGVGLFSAASYVYVWSDGIYCSLIEDGGDTRIDRTA